MITSHLRSRSCRLIIRGSFPSPALLSCNNNNTALSTDMKCMCHSLIASLSVRFTDSADAAPVAVSTTLRMIWPFHLVLELPIWIIVPSQRTVCTGLGISVRLTLPLVSRALFLLLLCRGLFCNWSCCRTSGGGRGRVGIFNRRVYCLAIR